MIRQYFRVAIASAFFQFLTALNVNAEAPSGPVNSQNAGAPVGGLVASQPTAADLESKAHQDSREEILSRLERQLKIKDPTFQSAADLLAVKTGVVSVPKLDTSKLSPGLAALAKAAFQLAEAKNSLQVRPDLPLDLDAITGVFDDAVKLLEATDPNVLAAELIKIGLHSAIDNKALLATNPKNLLPVLFNDFLSQTGLKGILGAFKQSEPIDPLTQQQVAPQNQQQKLALKLKPIAARLGAISAK
jgi:hypothetical protein